MRSDFINKRDIRRSRGITATQNFVESEVIVIPEFDTMFLHEPNLFGTQTAERWRDPKNIPSTLRPNPEFNTMPEMAIGLLNPWDDGHQRPDNSSGQITTQTRPRTPTRIAMAFNLASLPTNVQITDANLNLTVTQKRDWD